MEDSKMTTFNIELSVGSVTYVKVGNPSDSGQYNGEIVPGTIVAIQNRPVMGDKIIFIKCNNDIIVAAWWNKKLGCFESTHGKRFGNRSFEINADANEIEIIKSFGYSDLHVVA